MLFHRTRTSLLSNKDKKTPVCNVLTEKMTLHVASFSKMCTSQTVFHLEHQLYKISAFGPWQRCRWRLTTDSCQATARFLFWKLPVVHFKFPFSPTDQLNNSYCEGPMMAHTKNPGAQLGTQNKDFGAGSQKDLTRCLASSGSLSWAKPQFKFERLKTQLVIKANSCYWLCAITIFLIW